MKNTIKITALLVCLAGFGMAEEVEAGQKEVLGFVGGVTDGGGATFGGGIQLGIKPRWLFSGEFGYLTGRDNFRGLGANVDSYGISVDANVHYLFPLKSNEKFTPYVLAGVGFLRSSASVSVPGFKASASDSTAGLNLGGGARWAVGQSWGVRPEVKFLIADGSNARFSIGIYKTFGK